MIRRTTSKWLQDLRFDAGLMANISFSKWTECQSNVFGDCANRGKKNMLIHSFTGSGKTVAYLLPELQALIDKQKQMLVVLVPTRELAVQVGAVAGNLTRGIEVIKSRAVCSNEKLKGDENVVIATPGAMINNLGNIGNSTKLREITLVVDEVDRLMDFGFIVQLETILNFFCKNAAPNHRPKLVLSSATLSPEIAHLTRRLLGSDFVEIKSEQSVPTFLSHSLCLYAPLRFTDTLESLLQQNEGMENRQTGLVVFPTTRSLMFFYAVLKAINRLDRRVSALHGRMVNSKRMHVISKFMNLSGHDGNEVLMATDVAARGLDFPCLGSVIQIGFSGDRDNPADQYIHRAGRTARAGRDGKTTLMLGHGLDADSQVFKKLEEKINFAPYLFDQRDNPTITPPSFSGYERKLSVKCAESLLSWFLERKAILGIKKPLHSPSSPTATTPQARALDGKAQLVKSVYDMVRSAGLSEPRISQKLATKLKIDDIPGLRFSSFR